MEQIKIRDKRNKEWFIVDNAYLNGYAKIFGAVGTAIYISLCRHADNETQKCFPSQKLIAEELNISDRTVRNYIDRFVEWNLLYVVREKDSKGRNKNNEYILLDKSQWKPKPKSEKECPEEIVSCGSPEENNSSNPEENNDTIQRKQFPHNNTHINNTNNNNTNISKSEICEKNDINSLLDIFYQKINPTLNFGNKTERKALQEMIDKFGYEKVKNSIEYAISIQEDRFAPVITTPCELKRKMGQLVVYMQKNNKCSSPDGMPKYIKL